MALQPSLIVFLHPNQDHTGFCAVNHFDAGQSSFERLRYFMQIFLAELVACEIIVGQIQFNQTAFQECCPIVVNIEEKICCSKKTKFLYFTTQFYRFSPFPKNDMANVCLIGWKFIWTFRWILSTFLTHFP